MATRASRRVTQPGLALLLMAAGVSFIGWSSLARAAQQVGPPPTRSGSSTNSSAPPAEQLPLLGGPAPLGPSFGGCNLSLPSGADRDSGLSSLYLSNQQGRDFLLVPTLTGRETYSDNVGLASPGNEQSDFITEVIPGITACQSSRRIQSQFHYQLDALYYAKNQNRNNVYNEVEGETHAEVLPRHLFFDADTRYGQAVIDPQRTYSNDNALDTGNRTGAFRFRLSPSWIQSLGPLGISSTRYSYDRTLYNSDSVADSYSNAISFDLTNPPYRNVWSWDFHYRSEQFVRQASSGRRGRNTTYFDQASAQLGYQLTYHIDLLGEYGVEDDYQPDGTNDRFGSTFWNAGFRWTDQLNSFEFRYGHRFFGSTYLARLTHTGPQFTTSLSYRESPQVVTRRDQFGYYGDQGYYGNQGYYDNQGYYSSYQNPNSSSNLIFQPGEDQGQFALTPLNEEQVFLSRRLQGNTAYNTGRSTISFNAYWDRREFFQKTGGVANGGRSQNVVGAGASWRWQWLVRTALIPRVRWQRAHYDDGQTDRIHQEDLSLAHLISPSAQAGLTLRHQQRSSTSAGSEYRENAVIVEFIKIF